MDRGAILFHTVLLGDVMQNYSEPNPQMQLEDFFKKIKGMGLSEAVRNRKVDYVA